MIQQYWIPFALTLFAGLSTGVGSLIALLAKKTNRVFLSWSLGFSAGVMIYVSMIEIFPKAQESLIAELGKKPGMWATTIAFFVGFILIAIIDKMIPSFENPHEIRKVEDLDHVPSAYLCRLRLKKSTKIWLTFSGCSCCTQCPAPSTKTVP